MGTQKQASTLAVFQGAALKRLFGIPIRVARGKDLKAHHHKSQSGGNLHPNSDCKLPKLVLARLQGTVMLYSVILFCKVKTSKWENMSTSAFSRNYKLDVWDFAGGRYCIVQVYEPE